MELVEISNLSCFTTRLARCQMIWLVNYHSILLWTELLLVMMTNLTTLFPLDSYLLRKISGCSSLFWHKQTAFSLASEGLLLVTSAGEVHLISQEGHFVLHITLNFMRSLAFKTNSFIQFPFKKLPPESPSQVSSRMINFLGFIPIVWTTVFSILVQGRNVASNTITCRRYTVPSNEEISRNLIWEKVNSVLTPGMPLTSFHRRSEFRWTIDGQHVDFQFLYIVPSSLSGIASLNTVRLSNYPSDITQDQNYNQFKYVWYVKGKPFKSWWLDSNSECVAYDHDKLDNVGLVEKIVVYKRRKPF